MGLNIFIIELIKIYVGEISCYWKYIYKDAVLGTKIFENPSLERQKWGRGGKVDMLRWGGEDCSPGFAAQGDEW